MRFTRWPKQPPRGLIYHPFLLQKKTDATTEQTIAAYGEKGHALCSLWQIAQTATLPDKRVT